MDQINFKDIVKKASAFTFSTIREIDDIGLKSIEIFDISSDCIVLAVRHEHYTDIFWAADNIDCVIDILSRIQGGLRIGFVPAAAVHAFTEHGYVIKSHYIDHFNANIEATLSRISVLVALVFAEADIIPALVSIAAACSDVETALGDMDALWFSEWLKDNEVIVLVAAGHMAGFCCVSRYADIVWIRGMAVRPEAQGQGYGRGLLTQALIYGRITGARRAFLHADISNQKAIELYKSMDFNASGDDGEIIMIRQK